MKKVSDIIKEWIETLREGETKVNETTEVMEVCLIMFYKLKMLLSCVSKRTKRQKLGDFWPFSRRNFFDKKRLLKMY